jgi:hypothetical protein
MHIKANWKIAVISLVPLISGVQIAFEFNDRDSQILIGMSQGITKSENNFYPPGLISLIFPIIKLVENSIVHSYLGVLIGVLIIIQITLVYSDKIGKYNANFLIFILFTFNFPQFNEWIYSFSSMQMGILISSHLIFEFTKYHDARHQRFLLFYFLIVSMSLSSPAYLTFLLFPLLFTILFNKFMSICNKLKVTITLFLGSASWIIYRFLQGTILNQDMPMLARVKGAVPATPIQNFSNLNNNIELQVDSTFLSPSLNIEYLFPTLLVILLSLISLKHLKISIRPIALIVFFCALQYLFGVAEIYTFAGRAVSVLIIFSNVLFLNLIYELKNYSKINSILSGVNK